jgi:hypothetical protein
MANGLTCLSRKAGQHAQQNQTVSFRLSSFARSAACSDYCFRARLAGWPDAAQRHSGSWASLPLPYFSLIGNGQYCRYVLAARPGSASLLEPTATATLTLCKLLRPMHVDTVTPNVHVCMSPLPLTYGHIVDISSSRQDASRTFMFPRRENMQTFRRQRRTNHPPQPPSAGSTYTSQDGMLPRAQNLLQKKLLWLRRSTIPLPPSPPTPEGR